MEVRENILNTPRVDFGISSNASSVLLKMYSMRADHASTQIFLKTPMMPDATRCRNSVPTCSIGLNAIGCSMSEGSK